jgi:hypothetical protein
MATQFRKTDYIPLTSPSSPTTSPHPLTVFPAQAGIQGITLP